MNATMAKFLAMGMPFKEVIYRSTQRPAEVIHRPELGHIGVGAEADIAVLELREGAFGLVDSGRARMEARQQIECRATLRAGNIAWDEYGLSSPLWQEAGDYKRVK
jgi:dihydroorotase